MDAINQANNFTAVAQNINSAITRDNNLAATTYHNTLNDLREKAKATVGQDITKAGEKAARIYQVGSAYSKSAPLKARWSGVASARDTNAPEGTELAGAGEEAEDEIEEGGEALGKAVGESAAEKVARYGLKGAAIGLAGLDLAEDISKGGIAGDNWEQKVGNIGNITGGVLETAGMVVPFAAPELELAAGIVNVGASIFSDIGDILEDKEKKTQAKTDQQTTTQAVVVPQSSLVSQNLAAKPMTE